MIKNYLLIAWRNLIKHKQFSLINILGLAIGLASCFLIFLYVRNELTFDQYNTKYERIARITTTIHAPGSDIALAKSPPPLATALLREFPEVEAAVRLEQASGTVKINNDYLREEAFYYSDQSIFSIFDFQFLQGSANHALQQPNSIVITQTIAKKYFGNIPALGKTIIFNQQSLLVTGVVKDRPANSDLSVTALMAADFSKSTDWATDISTYTFVLFRKKASAAAFEKKITILSKKYVQPQFNAMDGQDYHSAFLVEPLSEVHFSKDKLEDTPKGNKQTAYIFSLLAIFILLIALLNYINLSTVKSIERAKEVGIRKVNGASPFQLIRQFLFESFVLITIAFIPAILLVMISHPLFSKLLQIHIAINWWHSIAFSGVAFIVTLLLAGLYPAFVLAAFKPITVLKGNWRHSGQGIQLRKVITIIQFAIATALIMGTTVFYSQLRYIQQKDLGFNKQQLLNIYLPGDSTYQNQVNSFRMALQQRPEIGDLTVGGGMMENQLTIGTTFVQQGGKKREIMCNYYAIDPHFLPVFQIKLAAGRNLSDSFGTDKNEAFLVNEAFVKAMGWKTAIGQPIEGWSRKGKVVGVVKNFYYKSIHNLIEPLAMVYSRSPDHTITVRIQPSHLSVVKTLFRKHFPAEAFNYAFFDEMVDQQFRKDKITVSLFTDLTILAIFVSCIGLYGLVALILIQKTKEIGIRKVLGASLNQLLSLLTNDLIKLLLWSLAIALPMGGILLHKWLNNYPYHTSLKAWMFVLPAALLLLIIVAVIGRQVIKAALINPAKSLRTE